MILIYRKQLISGNKIIKMNVVNVYSSIACNRTTEAADWGNNNLVLFGACNAVAVFDPSVCEL